MALGEVNFADVKAFEKVLDEISLRYKNEKVEIESLEDFEILEEELSIN